METELVEVTCVTSLNAHPVVASGLSNGYVSLLYADAEDTVDVHGKRAEYPKVEILPLGRDSS